MQFKEFVEHSNINTELDLLLEENLDESVKDILKNIKKISPKTKSIIKSAGNKTKIHSVADFGKHITNILLAIGKQFDIPKGEVQIYTNKVKTLISKFEKKGDIENQTNLSVIARVVNNSKIITFFEKFLLSIGIILTLPGGINMGSVMVLFLEIILLLSIFTVSFAFTVADKL